MDVREAILNSAETRMRASGFHGCGVLDIAADIGIDIADVHYHFASKAELAAAAVARYQARVFMAIGDAEDERDLATKLDSMRMAFRAGLADGRSVCLCGMLAAELHCLPPLVAFAIRTYFASCRTWLCRAFTRAGLDSPEDRASRITVFLHGAILRAIEFDDVGVFEAALQQLHVNVPSAE